MPEGGADTGVEGAAETDNTAGYVAVGSAALVATGAGPLALRRRNAGAR